MTGIVVAILRRRSLVSLINIRDEVCQKFLSVGSKTNVGHPLFSEKLFNMEFIFLITQINTLFLPIIFVSG